MKKIVLAAIALVSIAAAKPARAQTVSFCSGLVDVTFRTSPTGTTTSGYTVYSAGVLNKSKATVLVALSFHPVRLADRFSGLANAHSSLLPGKSAMFVLGRYLSKPEDLKAGGSLSQRELLQSLELNCAQS